MKYDLCVTSWATPDRVEIIQQYGLDAADVIIRFKTDPQMTGFTESDIAEAERDGRLILAIRERKGEE